MLAKISRAATAGVITEERKAELKELILTRADAMAVITSSLPQEMDQGAGAENKGEGIGAAAPAASLEASEEKRECCICMEERFTVLGVTCLGQTSPVAAAAAATTPRTTQQPRGRGPWGLWATAAVTENAGTASSTVSSTASSTGGGGSTDHATHFTCDSCLSDWVTSLTFADEASARAAPGGFAFGDVHRRKGQITCPGHRCVSPPLPLGVVVQRVECAVAQRLFVTLIYAAQQDKRVTDTQDTLMKLMSKVGGGMEREIRRTMLRRQ